MTERVLAALLACSVAGCRETVPAGLDGAVDWLLAQQRSDGAFPAEAYGVLRAAHSTTALAAHALASVRPRTPRIEAACSAALAFLRARGIVPEQLVDFPCYTAAHRILAAVALGGEDCASDVAESVAFLRARQLGPGRGWQDGDWAYGGFGYGVATGDAPDEGDVANLSATSLAVRALAAAGVPPSDPALAAAALFVERCQILAPQDPARHGGFVHQPGDGPLASKAGRGRPYATTTCDGLLALAALGRVASERAAAAAGWLARHARPPEVAGFEASDERERAYEPALRLYGLAVFARVTPLLPASAHAHQAIEHAVRARQRHDGAVVGWSPLLKEDEPMVATALAVLALTR